ncbi:zinc finger protein 608-like isoform X1 [Centruroides vittatus]|uniref:zinc finger protein 608-like isoform X1 n=2 Tax=Centruroides vittatus TaxID=120091 RepID=UPI00350F4684
MKDNLLDGHRGKVATNVTSTPTASGKTEVVGGPGPTNFDDDYNEWELGIGDLIIDLDADIEKNNDKYHGIGDGSVTFGLLTTNCDLTGTTSSMSSTKQSRMTGNSNSSSSSSSSSNSSSGSGGAGGAGSGGGGAGAGGAGAAGNGATVEHQATVDKGLKMKIKRKNVGSKFSEAKHEIVQSDTKVAHQPASEAGGAAPNCVQVAAPAEPKSKHSSGKGRSAGHREKKEKNKDKSNNKAGADVNGVAGNAHGAVSASIKLSGTNGGAASGAQGPTSHAASAPGANASAASCDGVVSAGNCLPSIMPSLTVKLETKYSSLPANSTVLLKPEDLPKSPPPKRVRVDKADPMRDAGTSTSVGTITEPECLGPCEPGTSVTLEGIVWQETEGGVLVVNVTWRGKTYVGTLLDCTKHDWAPPRFCESPTSDIDAKTSKARGKRGRGSTGTSSEGNNYNDSRATVQSKLRNCKGRRSASNNSSCTNSGFTVPSSPAKSESGTSNNGKRKGRPNDLELSPAQPDSKSTKRSRSQSRSTPTPNSSSAPVDFPQPSSPVLIECPEPNCSKKYKHINGLRYHQTHAHSNPEAGKIDDILEDGKDATNSSDNEENLQDSTSVPPSPAITPFSTSVSPHHHHESNNRTLSTSETISILEINTPSEGENYSEATDLSTLASVAINDSKKNSNFVHLSGTNNQLNSVIKCQENNDTSSNSEGTKPVSVNMPISGPASNISSHVGLTQSPSSSSSSSLSSSSLVNFVTSATTADIPSVTVSIPTSHVLFNQTSTVGSGSTTTTTSLVNLTSSAAMSVQSNNIATFFSPPVAVSSSVSSGTVDKSKLEKTEKYKLKSSSSTTVRPVISVPPTQVLPLSNNNSAPQTGTSHQHVTSSLKPIQPKPTILGEPTTINPALEGLKKEKSKHKKKSKERDKERKGNSTNLQSSKSQVLQSADENDRIGRPFEGLDTTIAKNVNNTASSSNVQQKQIVSSLGNTQSLNSDSNPADSSNINENVQSPAYSDISDANDSAPVLESEVPSNKDKDEVKSPPEVVSQAAAASLSTYGMYTYYSQPPYLIPSVPQNSVPSATLNVEKNDTEKKSETERNKEVRNWNCPQEVKIENSNVSQEKTEKKSSTEEGTTPTNIAPPSAVSNSGQQEYPIQQQYAYPYGYMQGYPYSVDATYHMHLLATDPHYKQQYEHFIEEQERLYREQAERQHKEQTERQHKEHVEKQQKEQERQHKEHVDKQHKEQTERHHKDHVERQHKEQIERQHKLHIQHSQIRNKEERSRESREKISEDKGIHPPLSVPPDVNKQTSASSAVITSKDREVRPPSHPSQNRVESSVTPSVSPVVTATTPLKDKQNENHQILKENIELKSQMDAGKVKLSQYEAAMLYERQREEMRRYYIMQERLIDQQKLETEHSQTQLQGRKDEMFNTVVIKNKPCNMSESTRPTSVILSPKSESTKSLSSSPKGNSREQTLFPKEYTNNSSSSKKESGTSSKTSEHAESSAREDKHKSDKGKIHNEGQKPTMETTGPPPPPTNSYAYLQPSYLQPTHSHFAHIPFDPLYRGSLSPMLMSTPPHYGSSHYLHSQLRYHVPSAPCDIPPHNQGMPDSLGPKLHPTGSAKALDLLHQVSQHYTCSTHKIHELHERAIMSPTTSTNSSTPTASTQNKASSSEATSSSSKQEVNNTNDRSQSPPPQRHLHTHHHTHVGVGYPLYDPYGAMIASQQAVAAAVGTIHPYVPKQFDVQPSKRNSLLE